MLQGSYVAIVTPWNSEGGIDRDKLADLIEFQIENGTAGIVPCGTTGESATMSHDEHHEVIRFTIEQVRGRVQVIAGTGSNSTAEALSLTKAAKDMGADAALLISPYYNKPTQEGLYQHYKKIAEEAAMPLIVYDCPSRTGSSVQPATIARLSQLDHIVALKDAEGSIDYTSAVAASCDITILSGNDSMNLPIMAVGGKGAISVLANVAPRAVADLCDAALKGQADEARALHLKYFDLCKALFVETNPIPVKAACELMGLCSRDVRLPLVPITEGGLDVLRTSMQKVGLFQP